MPSPSLTTNLVSVSKDAMNLDSNTLDPAHHSVEVPHIENQPYEADKRLDQQIAVDAEAEPHAASPEAFAEHIADVDREEEDGAGKLDGTNKDELVEDGTSCMTMVLFRPTLLSTDNMDVDSKPIKPKDGAGSSPSGLQHQASQAVALRAGTAYGYEVALKKHRKLRSSSQETTHTRFIERERSKRVQLKLDAQERERKQWLDFVADRNSPPAYISKIENGGLSQALHLRSDRISHVGFSAPCRQNIDRGFATVVGTAIGIGLERSEASFQ
ncbi:hypothetical protein A4X13_0g7913 [Tilletia indica]|uniref:Uncharacterized protein n=1 Tax=Tilletia indica TaxID=43049 RepID=A0A8T8SH89_9BASI|nr:hypothetical protein A4X13_0g7913 [Tilletia indica]